MSNSSVDRERCVGLEVGLPRVHTDAPYTTKPLGMFHSPKAIHSLKGVSRVADGDGGDPLLGLTIPSPFDDWL